MGQKIGIDFHGVISAAPETFGVFTKEIRLLGIEVHIISGGPKMEIIRYLHEHHIEYDEVWAILDHYTAEGKTAFFDDGSFQIPTELWNRAKAEYCAREGIKFHIDDSLVYGKYFATHYCQYLVGEESCAIKDGFCIDFKEPQKAAYALYRFLTKDV